jgi:hypothetical protein
MGIYSTLAEWTDTVKWKEHNMGRKSSAKTPTRSGSPAPSPSEPSRTPRAFIIVATIAALGLIGAFYVRTMGPGQTPAQASPSPAATQTPAEPPAIALTPHPQSNLPPLPLDPMPPARPMEIVRAAYTWAAEHPEIATYVPCYCGCEHSGHRGSEDCFVSVRNDRGDVTQWEPHGMT